MLSPIKISEQFLDIAEGNIWVKSWIPASSRSEVPVVLLHDSLGCVEMWRDFPRLLCERLGRPVIAYDRLGFGRSSERQEPPSADFVSEEAEVYLPAILRALGIGRLVLLGHSVGGAMALVFASRRGNACDAVVTESAQAFVEDRTRHGILQAKADFKNPEVFRKLHKYHGNKTRWVLDAWIETWLSKEFSNWSLMNDLPKVHCPILAIHGDKDEYGSVKFPEMICELAGGPAVKKILPDAGHVPHRENPDLILSLIADFLNDFS